MRWLGEKRVSFNLSHLSSHVKYCQVDPSHDTDTSEVCENNCLGRIACVERVDKARMGELRQKAGKESFMVQD